MEDMGQEGQENPGPDPQLESVGLKNRSAAGRIDLRRLHLMISALLPIQFYTQSLTLTVLVSLHVYFHLVHFGDPIKSATLSPFTTKEMQPEWCRLAHALSVWVWQK